MFHIFANLSFFSCPPCFLLACIQITHAGSLTGGWGVYAGSSLETDWLVMSLQLRTVSMATAQIAAPTSLSHKGHALGKGGKQEALRETCASEDECQKSVLIICCSTLQGEDIQSSRCIYLGKWLAGKAYTAQERSDAFISTEKSIISCVLQHQTRTF